MLTTKEIFARTLKVVACLSEIDAKVIVSKDRHEEVVDARILLIHLLNKQGLYPSRMLWKISHCKIRLRH